MRKLLHSFCHVWHGKVFSFLAKSSIGKTISVQLLYVLILFQPVATHAQNITPTDADSMLQLFSALDDSTEKLDSLLWLADMLLVLDAERGHAVTDLVEDLIRKSFGDEQHQRRFYKLRGSMYVIQSEHDSALYYLNKSMQMSEAAGDIILKAKTLHKLANLYTDLADYPKALECHFTVLSLGEDTENFDLKLDAFLGIANVYRDIGEWELSLQYDTLALNLTEEVIHLNERALIWGNMANSFIELALYDEAKTYYEKAIEGFRSLGHELHLGRNLANLATYYLSIHDYAKSREVLYEAIESFNRSGFTTGLAYSYINLGMVYHASYFGKTDTDFEGVLITGTENELASNTIFYLEKALNLGLESNLYIIVYNAAQLLHTFNLSLGNYKSSLENLKLASNYNDTIQLNSSREAIEQLITEREILIREKQIELDLLELQKKRNERWYLSGGTVLLFVVLAFMVRNYQNQRYAHVKLSSLNEQVTDANVLLSKKNDDLANTFKLLKNTEEQLIETEKQKERAELREQISQDIHDDISSGLTKISWLAELNKAKMAKQQTPEELALLNKINDYSKEATQKLGEIIWSTNPESDNLTGMLAYMRQYAVKFFEDLTLRYEINFPEIENDSIVEPEVRRNLFLVFKEALNNAAKYSQADLLIINFTVTDDSSFELSVSDNGIGIEPEILKGSGNGLKNMHSRMDAIGGKVDIKSSPNGGTTLVFSIG